MGWGLDGGVGWGLDGGVGGARKIIYIFVQFQVFFFFINVLKVFIFVQFQVLLFFIAVLLRKFSEPFEIRPEPLKYF